MQALCRHRLAFGVSSKLVLSLNAQLVTTEPHCLQEFNSATHSSTFHRAVGIVISTVLGTFILDTVSCFTCACHLAFVTIQSCPRAVVTHFPRYYTTSPDAGVFGTLRCLSAACIGRLITHNVWVLLRYTPVAYTTLTART